MPNWKPTDLSAGYILRQSGSGKLQFHGSTGTIFYFSTHRPGAEEDRLHGPSQSRLPGDSAPQRAGQL